MNYPIELIHIDRDFIHRYRMVDVPYIKAGDHIFLAVAKVDGIPLITSDAKLIAAAKKCGVKVFHVKELVESSQQDT
jgi:predicted nucleic acid-binding protein